jgi:polysaccharide pyruvyl transferase WcaK-like protein
MRMGRYPVIPDPAFCLRPGKMEDAICMLERAGWISGQARPLVALTPRLLRSDDGEAHTHYVPASSDEIQKEVQIFAAVLDWLWENGYHPVFVPMNTVPPDSDLDSAQQIIVSSRSGKNCLVISEEIFPRDAANIYQQCHAAFVSRVHGSITAFLGRCPSMMYAFGLKHAGIMQQMEMSGFILNPLTHSAQDAVALMAEMLEQRVNLLDHMERLHDGLIQRARLPLEVVLKTVRHP